MKSINLKLLAVASKETQASAGSPDPDNNTVPPVSYFFEPG